MADAPDLIGPVTAWRAWKVDYRDTGVPFLRSMAFETEWLPGEALRAGNHDRGGEGLDHAAPQADCVCGIYVLDTVDALMEESTQIRHHVNFVRRLAEQKTPEGHAFVAGRRTVVVGEVDVWGRSVRHEQGRRVEYAQVRSIASTPIVNGLSVELAELAERYDVPLVDEPGVSAGIERVSTRHGEMVSAAGAQMAAAIPGGAVMVTVSAQAAELRRQMEEAGRKMEEAAARVEDSARRLGESAQRYDYHIAADGTITDGYGRTHKVEHHTAGLRSHGPEDDDPSPSKGLWQYMPTRLWGMPDAWKRRGDGPLSPPDTEGDDSR